VIFICNIILISNSKFENKIKIKIKILSLLSLTLTFYIIEYYGDYYLKFYKIDKEYKVCVITQKS